jgi:hypothetical protein
LCSNFDRKRFGPNFGRFFHKPHLVTLLAVSERTGATIRQGVDQERRQKFFERTTEDRAPILPKVTNTGLQTFVITSMYM